MKLLHLAKQARSLLPEALLAAGAVTASYGVWLIYVPAGWITGGILLCAAGYFVEKGRAA